MQPDQSKQPKRDKALAPMQPGEQFICEIRRHPIGLFAVYARTAIMVFLLLIVATVVPGFVDNLPGQVSTGIIVGAFVLLAFTLLHVYIRIEVYQANHWVVTSDSISEVIRTGLFNKQTSQLSLANLEDVTVDQNGLFPNMFGYGVLHVETAGEHSKFIFPLCPKPNEYARKIIAAHQAYIARKPQETMAANQALVTGQAFNQTPPSAGTVQQPKPPQ